MLSNISEIAGQSFDYIIIGGGTTGLTIASRLAENSKLSVLVLEAGEPNLDDPKILLGGRFGSTFFDPKYDWGFATVPQKHSNNQVKYWFRGKGLGGSSLMNYYLWCKPPATDVNAFEELGNPGWNWDSYLKYTLRAEHFTPATEEQITKISHTHNPQYRGAGGPIQTTVPGTSTEITKLFLNSIQAQGGKLIEDAYGGEVTGCWLSSANLDRNAQWTRSSSATAYYAPHRDKSNLKVLTEALVARVIFSDQKQNGLLVTTGVEFIHGGETYVAYAKTEVICSAGTIKSPQILELSGIGQKEVLERIGVPIKLDLPGVGENVQEHPICGVSYELKDDVNYETFDVLRDPELAQEHARLQAQGEHNMHRYGITAMAYLPIQLMDPNEADQIIDGASRYIENQKKEGKLPPGLEEQYEIQLRILKDKTQPDLELMGYPGFMTFKSAPEKGKPHLTVLIALQHPFSRGRIHAKSNDPLEQPEIDGGFFENPYDLKILAEDLKFVRSMATVEPLKSRIVREVDPGLEISSIEGVKNYLKDTCVPSYHATGSLSMLPRENNGVVNPKLKVYGTSNLRVADLSIIPLSVAAHTQSTAYYIGEYLADIIKGVI